MPEITGSLDQFSTATDCNDKGGIRVLYWTEYNNIDWAAMAADALQFDQTTRKVLAYTMVSSATFNKIEFERKTAFYDFTYTSDADVVSLLMTLAFKGKDNDRKNSLDHAIRTCAIVCHIYDENGKQRVIGVDWNGVTFNLPVEYLEVKRILDSSGQKGSSKSRDEMDLGGEQDFLPLFAEVVETAIPV